MTTRLFFHAATSGLSNLPSTEQSTLTATYSVDAQTVNKTMDPIKGTGQVVLTKSLTSTSSQNAYFTKFVSPLIDTATTGTTISANTWDYCFGVKENNLTMNFPVNGTAQSVYVNCYVWDTNAGTLVGTILDGNSTANYDEPTSAGTNTYIRGTFTGAAVSSVTSTCVLVMEIWFVFTPGVTGDTLSFNYDGTQVSADNTSNSQAASFIGTPQDITFSGVTKLFFRSASNSLAGTLPTAEQSALTETVHADAQTVNRTLNTAKGAAQTSLSVTTNAVITSQNLYFTKFVSWQYLNVTSIPAANWSYTFAVKEANLAANFPVTSTNKAVYVNLYVWKTSTGAVTGTILDGNTTAAFDEPSAINTEVSEIGTFVGAAVPTITPGDDVLVFEVWFQVTQGGATARVDNFFYEGATETFETGVTVADSASALTVATPITFTPTQGGAGQAITKSLTETITISSTSVRLAGKLRPRTETITIASTPTRLATKLRPLVTQSITIASTPTRIKGAVKSQTETITIASIPTRLATKFRSIADSIATSPTVARIKFTTKTIATSLTTSSTVAKIKGSVKSLTESIVTASTVTRLDGKIRTIADSITIASTPTKIKGAIKSITDTITTSSAVTTVKSKFRSLTESITISSTPTILRARIRSIAESLTTSSTPTKVTAKIRLLADTITISDLAIGIRIRAVVETLTETLTIADSVNRLAAKIRSLPESISTSGSPSRLSGKIRALTPEAIAISSTLDRIKAATRSLTETTTITSTATRLVEKIRSITQVVGITDAVTQSKAGINNVIKILTETLTISDTITNARAKIRSLTETISPSLDSLSKQAAKSRSLPTESVAISPGTITRQRGIIKALSDALSALSTLSRLTAKLRPLTETTTIQDQLSQQGPRVQAKQPPGLQVGILTQNLKALQVGVNRNIARTFYEVVRIADHTKLDVTRYAVIQRIKIKKINRLVQIVNFIDQLNSEARRNITRD